jgi:glycosyltransferase involved in cell wall biosynthesis
MVFRLGEDLGVHAADGIIVVSQEIAEHIERKYGKTAVVIGNGAPIPQEKQSPDHLLEMGIQPNRYILAVGRLVPDKGFHKLIEAFTSLDTNDALLRHQGWKLLIVGNLNRRDEYCRSLVSRSRAVRNVILTGFLERPMLDELYAHAGLFVLPSCHEGHSVTLLEALSHGASCLASDIPANRVFRMEEYRYFKPDDVDALALGIRRLCGMPWSADARRAQIERTRQRFDWNEIAERTKGVYEAVVSGTVLKPR